MHAGRQAGRQAVVSYRRRPRRRAGATARGRTAASVATTIQSPGQTFQHTRPAAAVAPGRQGRSPTSGGAALPRSTAGDGSRCAADRGSASAASSTAPLAVAVRPSPTCTLRHAVAVGTAGWQGTARAVRGRPARAEAERGGATPDRDDTSSPACAVCIWMCGCAAPAADGCPACPDERIVQYQGTGRRVHSTAVLVEYGSTRSTDGSVVRTSETIPRIEFRDSTAACPLSLAQVGPACAHCVRLSRRHRCDAAAERNSDGPLASWVRCPWWRHCW